MFVSRMLACVLSVSLLGLAVGCQSSGSGATAMSKPTKAVVVTGQGSTTIYIPSGDGAAVLASDSQHKCAQCEADAAAYFKTGKMDPKCSACGALRTPVSGTN